MKRTAPLRLDLVIRTSQRRKDGQSPDQQRQQAEAAATAGGHQIAAVHDSGRSESGKTMDREAVRAVKQRIRSKQTDGIIVGYLDRLGRAPIEETMSFIRELLHDGGVLVAADWDHEPIDLSDPNVEDMLVFRCQMNRSQWTKAKQRYQLSQTNAIKAGKFIGPTPLGYVRATKGRLVPHPTLGPIITKAYEVAALDGLRAAQEYLGQQVPDRVHQHGQDFWTATAARRLLRSRVYLGESWAWSGEGTKRVRTVNEQAHDALTTPELFDAATTRPKVLHGRGDYPLSKLVMCGECGHGMTGQHARFNDRGVQRAYRRYRCSNRACWKVSVNADQLEAHLRGTLKRTLATKAFRDAFAPAGLADAQDALRRAERDRERWAKDDRARDLMGDDSWYAGLEKRAEVVKAASDRYAKLTSQSAVHQVLPLPNQLDDPEHFARALRALVEAVTITILPAPIRPSGRVAHGTPVEDRVSLAVRDEFDHVSRALSA